MPSAVFDTGPAPTVAASPQPEPSPTHNGPFWSVGIGAIKVKAYRPPASYRRFGTKKMEERRLWWAFSCFALR